MCEVTLEEWSSGEDKGLCMLYMTLHIGFARCFLASL